MPFSRCALAALLLLAACSGGGGEESGNTPLEVGVVPVIDVAPLYLGIERGFFAEQGLDVRPRQIQTGATVVAAVVAGDQPIGFSNNTTILTAASKKAPVRIVAAGNQAPAGDYAVIFAPEGGTVRKAEDLPGKRIAVNSLNNIGSLATNAALEAKGIDIGAISYVEIPFPQMQQALVQKRIDAAWIVEPFASIVRTGGGATPILSTYPLIAAHFPVGSYFTSSSYAQQNAEVVGRFRTAMNRSLEYAQAHPDDVRRILPTFIKLSPEVAAEVVLPEWSTDVGVPLLHRTVELAARYGYLTTEPDVDALVAG